MEYQPYQIYHIFNQGNNREKIFFQERNYPFFLGKMRKFLLPFADILAYCLMPNHFHWLIYTRQCFEYIHKNPEEAKLVNRAEAWPYSSAREHAGLRKKNLCNLQLAAELLDL